VTLPVLRIIQVAGGFLALVGLFTACEAIVADSGFPTAGIAMLVIGGLAEEAARRTIPRRYRALGGEVTPGQLDAPGPPPHPATGSVDPASTPRPSTRSPLSILLVVQIAGWVAVVLGVGLFIGNRTGVFPTFPLAGFVTIGIGGVVARWAASRGSRGPAPAVAPEPPAQKSPGSPSPSSPRSPVSLARMVRFLYHPYLLIPVCLIGAGIYLSTRLSPQPAPPPVGPAPSLAPAGAIPAARATAYHFVFAVHDDRFHAGKPLLQWAEHRSDVEPDQQSAVDQELAQALGPDNNAIRFKYQTINVLIDGYRVGTLPGGGEQVSIHLEERRYPYGTGEPDHRDLADYTDTVALSPTNQVTSFSEEPSTGHLRTGFTAVSCQEESSGCPAIGVSPVPFSSAPL
jgi:hypothetical protein